MIQSAAEIVAEDIRWHARWCRYAAYGCREGHYLSCAEGLAQLAEYVADLPDTAPSIITLARVVAQHATSRFDFSYSFVEGSMRHFRYYDSYGDPDFHDESFDGYLDWLSAAVKLPLEIDVEAEAEEEAKRREIAERLADQERRLAQSPEDFDFSTYLLPNGVRIATATNVELEEALQMYSGALAPSETAAT